MDEDDSDDGGSLGLQMLHKTQSLLSSSELEVSLYLDDSCFLLFALGGAALNSLSLMSSSINSFVGCTAVCSFLRLLNVALMFVLVPQNHCRYILHYPQLLGEET